METVSSEPVFVNVKGAQELNCRYDNPIFLRFLAPIDCSKIPAQYRVYSTVYCNCAHNKKKKHKDDLRFVCDEMVVWTEPVFANLLRSPGIDSQSMAAGTTTLFVIPARQATYIGWRNCFLGIESSAP
jgi:hypothetical protein